MSSRSRERYFPFILPVIFYHTHRRKQPFSINIRACAYATLCKACSSQWLLFQNIKFYIVLRETGRGEKDERAPTGWLFGCTEPGVKAEKSHRCAHSHAPALCRSQQHRHWNIIAANPLKIRGGYTYTLAALALSRHSYSNYAPYGLHFYFYLTWVVFFY